MKLVADYKGRLTAAKLFKPGYAFDASRQPDGSIRIMELAERQVPIVRAKRKPDGSFEPLSLMTRKEIVAAVRADREAQ